MTRHFTARSSRLARNPRRFPPMLEALERRDVPSNLPAYGSLPLAFEPNVGQTAQGVDFIARGEGYGIALTPSGATLSLKAPGSAGTILGFSLVGSSASAAGQAQDKLPGVSNYLIGDASQWHTNVPNYGQVQYAGVYPGVNVIYYGSGGQLEFDLVLAPGASVGQVRWQITGAQSIRLDAQGDLVLHTPAGDVLEKAPVLYQVANGTRQAVAGRYVLQDGGTVGVAVGAYDHAQRLTIDPYFSYSSYLGGSGSDAANGIAVDATGSVYVAGVALSTDFPTAAAFQSSVAGGTDAFVSKFSPDGSTLIYSTYLGGAGSDEGLGIAVDASGSAYVTGDTGSTDFPTTVGAFQTANFSSDTAFVTKLAADGASLSYSTYLGGTGQAFANGIAVDNAGDAYVAGTESGTDFPTTAGAAQTTPGGNGDGFVSKLAANGATLAYSTLLGGSDVEGANAIALDAAGNAYVTGGTTSTDFPTTAGALRTSGGTSADAFVTKVAADGASFGYSTYLGGTDLEDAGFGIAVDSAGNAYVTGYTLSSTFPTTAGAFQPNNAGGARDAFVSKLTPDGTGLAYSTYLGGAQTDQGNAIAVNSLGEAYVTGTTDSLDYPTTLAAPQPFPPGAGANKDAFVTRLDPAGDQAWYSTYLGGTTGDDLGNGIAVDALGNTYVTGSTSSSDFPTTGGTRQGTLGGTGSNAFVTKLAVWTATDVSVNNSTGKSEMLWGSGDGSIEQWGIPSVPGPVATQGLPIGPNVGWVPRANVVGSDGLTRVLYTNALTGAVAIFQLDVTLSFSSAVVFGAPSGWQAEDIQVGTDNLVRLLWTNADTGKAAIWKLDASNNFSSAQVFGPHIGYLATHLSAAPDGSFFILWAGLAGQASFWHIDASGAVLGSSDVGPFSGWLPVDITSDSNNQAHILWDNTSGMVALWNLDSSLAFSSAQVYGPFPGFTAVALSASSGSDLRLLWSRPDETVAVWVLDLTGAFQSANVYTVEGVLS